MPYAPATDVGRGHLDPVHTVSEGGVVVDRAVLSLRQRTHDLRSRMRESRTPPDLGGGSRGVADSVPCLHEFLGP
jgi:hypothetical protein